MTRISPASAARLWRYYQIGVINTIFGYSMFAILVAAGLNIYLAQILAHILGVTFNYVSYSRHVFQNNMTPKLRFLLSYAFNYLVGLGSLAAATQVISSPYIAGLGAVLFTSLVNFIVLRNLVFTRPIT